MADIRQVLSQAGLHWKEVQRHKGLTAILNCFKCGDTEQKMAISLVDGSFNCMHLNNCGIKGSFWQLQQMLGLKPQKLDNNDTILRQPIKYVRPVVHSELADKAVEYLKTRGLTENTIKKFKIGYKDGAVMFPYFKNGELVNVKYRSIAEKKFWKEKDAEPTLFNRDACNGEALICVEGEIDSLSMMEYDIPAVSLPSGANDLTWIENEWEYLDKFQKIYLCLDGDTAGQQAVENLVKRLGTWRCYSVVLPYKDANECLQNKVEAKTILEAIANAKEFDPPTLLKASDFEEEINYINEHPEDMYGISTPWKGLTDLLKGWRKGELTIWSGRSSAGKSTMLNDVIYSLLKHGHKVIIASLEMQPKKYLRWMTMRIKQKEKLSREEVKEALSELKNLHVVNVIGTISSSELFDIFNFAARKYGVKHFIIDSLMKINIAGADKYEEQKLFCNYLIDNIAKVYQGHIHLVAHPRKGFKDTDRPDKVDVAGTSDLTNLADNVITIYRLSKEEKEKNNKEDGMSADAVLYLKKNREAGLEGDVNFRFDEFSKTFIEI